MSTPQNIHYRVVGFVSNKLEGKHMGGSGHGLMRDIQALAQRDRKT